MAIDISTVIVFPCLGNVDSHSHFRTADFLDAVNVPEQQPQPAGSAVI